MAKSNIEVGAVTPLTSTDEKVSIYAENSTDSAIQSRIDMVASTPQISMNSQTDSDNGAYFTFNGDTKTVELFSQTDGGATANVRVEEKLIKQDINITEGVVSAKTGLISTGVVGATSGVISGGRTVSHSTIGQGIFESVATGNDDERITKSNSGTNYGITTYDDTNNTKASFTLNKNFVLNINETGDGETVLIELHKLGEPDTKVLMAMVAETDGFRYNVEASKDGDPMRFGHSCHHATGSVSAEMYQIDTDYNLDVKFRGLQPSNIIDGVKYSVTSADDYIKNELIQSEANGFQMFHNVPVVAGVEDFTNSNSFTLNGSKFEVKVLDTPHDSNAGISMEVSSTKLISHNDVDSSLIEQTPTTVAKTVVNGTDSGVQTISKNLVTTTVTDTTNTGTNTITPTSSTTVIGNGSTVTTHTHVGTGLQVSAVATDALITHSTSSGGKYAEFTLDPNGTANGTGWLISEGANSNDKRLSPVSDKTTVSDGSSTTVVEQSPLTFNVTPDAGVTQLDIAGGFITAQASIIQLTGRVKGVTSVLPTNNVSYNIPVVNNKMHIIYTGPTGTMTLPIVSGNTGVEIYIVHKGTGTLTIQSNNGVSTTIWDAGANTATTSIIAGQIFHCVNDGTDYSVIS